MNRKELSFLDYENYNYVCFWGIKNPNSFMSNFYKSEFKEGDLTFSCNEQYFMYHKAILFNDYRIANEIIKKEYKYPQEYKNLGREVKNYNDNVWNNNRDEIMRKGLILKFTQNPNLKKILIDTGNSILVEASPYDKIWGIGLPAMDIKHKNPNKWNGENKLGFLLMEIRDYIKNN